MTKPSKAPRNEDATAGLLNALSSGDAERMLGTLKVSLYPSFYAGIMRRRGPDSKWLLDLRRLTVCFPLSVYLPMCYVKGLPKELVSNAVEVLRKQANEAFAKGDFKQAVGTRAPYLHVENITWARNLSRGCALPGVPHGVSLCHPSLPPSVMNADLYTQALSGAPSDKTLYSNRSLAYLRRGQNQAALDDANKALEVPSPPTPPPQPFSPRLCFHTYAPCFMLNRVQLDEDWVKGHYRKGAALMALERPLDALPHLREVRLDSHDYMEHTIVFVHGACGSMEYTMSFRI